MGQLLVAFRGTTPNNNNNNNNAATQGLRRLFALFSTFFPFGGQRQMNDAEQAETEVPSRGGDRNNQPGESEVGGARPARFGRGRRRGPPMPANSSGSGGGETGGRGSPNSGGSSGTYFGSHFLMGGELYEASKPEVFLFGDQQDLELLGNKSVKFPLSAKGVTDSVGVLNALVNVRKDSVKFTKIGRSGGGYSSGFYRLEFVFDCDVSCFVQIHFCAQEQIDEQQPQLIQILSRQPQFERSERFHFPVGANQQFSHFTFKPHRYDLKMMHWDGGPFFPVVIEIRSVSDQFPEQVQTTLCSIERSNDQSAVLILKPMKQKLFSDGVVFLLQEIFGIENKENAETAPPALAEENGAECIICMANSRDTMILPCRHLCICNGCAETLRYKLNNCPICRSPFKALLKIRAMRNSLVGQGVGSDGSMTTTRIRREPMTLIEAINGPFASSTAPPPLHGPFIAASVGTTVGQQSPQQSGEERQTTAANAAGASMVARCQGSQVVTSTVVRPLPPPPFVAVSNYLNHHKVPFPASQNAGVVVLQQQQQQKQQHLPRHQTVPLSDSSQREVIVIDGGGEAMAGTATVIDWLRRVKSPQLQEGHVILRNDGLLEAIEMGQLRSRRGASQSNAVRRHRSSADNSFGSRSPSLCRAGRHRHSQLSASNASFQSARSFCAKNSGSIGQMELEAERRSGQRRNKPRQNTTLLGSTPNLANRSRHTSRGRGESEAMEVKRRKRSETLATEKGRSGHLESDGRTKRTPKLEKEHWKRRSDTPRVDFDDDPMMS